MRFVSKNFTGLPFKTGWHHFVFVICAKLLCWITKVCSLIQRCVSPYFFWFQEEEDERPEEEDEDREEEEQGSVKEEMSEHPIPI